MPRAVTGLKHRMLRLLKEDEEFRYAVAGLIGLEDIAKRIDSLNERVGRLEDAVTKLTEGQSRLEDAMARLIDVVADTRKELAGTRMELANTRKELGGLSATVGAISESSARKALREWLKQRGLAAERLQPITVIVDEEEHEINFHGLVTDIEGKKIPLYAEAKSTIRAREVKDFAKISKQAEKTHGEGIKAIIAYRIYEDAYKAAEEEQIQIIEA